MPTRHQVRLARILRDDEVMVRTADGRQQLMRVNIRPIATHDAGTGADLIPDLMRKLAQTRIALPPLRERREDIPALVRYLLVDICAELSLPIKTASSQAVELLAALPWRGNVRELRDLLRVVVLKSTGRLLRLSDVLAQVRLDGGAATFMYTGTLRDAREQFERDYVQAVLQQHRGRMAEAAKVLGLQRTNLYRKVRQLSVKRGASQERSS
jgi:two-component system nitrogen regulation response regulator NtrX